MTLPYKKGSSGPEVRAWQDWAYSYAKSYADLIGPKDAYYGLGEAAFTTELQRRLGIPQTGVFDEFTAGKVHFKINGTPVAPPRHRKIWFYSNPGSGADEFSGPSFEVGELCKKILNLNHQPVHSAVGGYLGLMGGDPSFSYNESIYDEYKSLEWLHDNNPEFQEAYRARLADPKAVVEWEGWYSGYSQKADGVEDALEILFGDGGFRIPATGEVVGPGKYRILRDRINGVIQFGNPSKRTTGIARKPRPEWLYKLVHNLNHPNDFYAEAPDAIRPAFYAIIVQAEMELPFFVHVLRIAIPIITQTIPIFGGILGPLAPTIVAGMAGISALTPLLGGLMGGMAGGSAGDDAVDRKIIDMLSVTGLIKNIPGLLQLVAALPGLQAHGDWGPLVQPGYDVVARFTR